jgi:hypothetical protein
MTRPPTFAAWRPALLELSDGIRDATSEALASALRAAGPRVERPAGQGAGDVTYGLDLPSEELAAAWLEREAARTPLSLLTEDAGWRHMGPRRPGDPSSGAVELDGFDHGGPRIGLDPVDGTRNLMADLRPAWTVLSFAGAGAGRPLLSELSGGVVSELPPSNAARARRLVATSGGGTTLETLDLESGAVLEAGPLSADDDDRADHGYFPFFRYQPEQRPALARIEAAFFERLAREEGADPRHCFDDQYISNAGQMVLLALGTYRMVTDLRAWLAAKDGGAAVTSKPYDVAGAILCARAAGCEVTAPDGGPLDFPLDAETPVSFVGWHNPATRRRLAPHLSAALGT